MHPSIYRPNVEIHPSIFRGIKDYLGSRPVSLESHSNSHGPSPKSRQKADDPGTRPPPQHKKYKTVVGQAQKMCEDVDSVLDIVVQLKARGVIVQQNNPDPTGFTPREEGWEQHGLEKMGKARLQGDKAAGKYG
jgi:hypothetical protein